MSTQTVHLLDPYGIVAPLFTDRTNSARRAQLDLSAIGIGSTQTISIPNASGVMLLEGLASSNNTVGKTIHVDTVYGSDATGLRGRRDKPFATLTAAVAASGIASGDSIMLGAGTFTVTTLTLPSGVNLYGAGMNNTIIQSNLASEANGCFIVPGNNSVIANLSIGSASSPLGYSMPVGSNAAVPQSAFTNAILINVKTFGITDGIYISTPGCTMTCYNCIFYSNWDTVYVGGAGSVVELYSCQTIADGTGATNSSVATCGPQSNSSGKVRMFGGSITSYGSPYGNFGCKAYSSGTTELHAVVLDVSGSFSRDIEQTTFGVVAFNAVVRRDGGSFSYTTGTITFLDANLKTIRLVPTSVKSSTYNAAAYDLVPVNCTSSSVTVNLPNAPADGTRVGVILITIGGSNTVTVQTQGSDVFNKFGSGVTTATLSLLNQAFIVQYKSSTGIWYIIDERLPLSALLSTFDARYQPISVRNDTRLSLVSGSLLLKPFGGNQIFINGSTYILGSSGITLAVTGLTASTLYYIYVYNNSGTLTLEASTTTHATDSTYGSEIKSGDATRVLVGMAYVVAGPAFADSLSQRLVRSWSNRVRPVNYVNSGASSTSSTTAVEYGNTAEFLVWSDESVNLEAASSVYNNYGSGYTASLGIKTDGSVLQGEMYASATNGPGYYIPVSLSLAATFTEGRHIVSLTQRADGQNWGFALNHLSVTVN